MSTPAGRPRVTQIAYPLGDIPAPGEVKEVADGVLWVRMPLPIALDHINLYLIRDGDGWVMVDSGIKDADIQQHWEQIFRDALGGLPVRRVIATHLHPDHVGMAGWVTRHFGVELWMTRTEFFLLRMLAVDGPRDLPQDALEFYRRIGFSEEHLDAYRMRFGSFGALIHPLPAGFRRIQDGDQLEMGGRVWEVVIGRGHSPEHACLYCPELQLLIAGDQVLPRISSNVSVHPTEPFADPLSEWIESCADIPTRVPGDVLVLPAHNEPFTGLHRRLSDLIEHHHEALSRIHSSCDTPQTVLSLFPALFGREIDGAQFFMAAGESLAHVNYLATRGLLERELDTQGVAHYRRVGERFEPSALHG